MFLTTIYQLRTPIARAFAIAAPAQTGHFVRMAQSPEK